RLTRTFWTAPPQMPSMDSLSWAGEALRLVLRAGVAGTLVITTSDDVAGGASGFAGEPASCGTVMTAGTVHTAGGSGAAGTRTSGSGRCPWSANPSALAAGIWLRTQAQRGSRRRHWQTANCTSGDGPAPVTTTRPSSWTPTRNARARPAKV